LAAAELTCAARHWSADNASTAGAALAFYCAFSIAPLLVILLTLAGLVVSEYAAYEEVGGELNALFGPATARILMGAVHSAEHADGLIATSVSGIRHAGRSQL
jgi:membrane protein